MIGIRTRSRAAQAPAHRLLAAPSLYQVAFLAVMGGILIVALAPRLDPDLWWHMAVGRHILARHTVPQHDYLSFVRTGSTWTDHEWLSEVIMYVTYRWAGLWGPIVFFAGVIAATFTLVYYRLAALGTNRLLASFVTAACFMASSASWGPRVQMFTLLFLAATLLMVERYLASGRRAWLCALPALMLLWVNLHGGFVLGLAVLVLSIVGEWLNRRTRLDSSPSRVSGLCASLAVSLAAVLCNPLGVRALLYPLTFLRPNAFTNLIQESASPDFHLPAMMIFEALLLVTVAAVWLARTRVDWRHVLLMLAFTHLALSQGRNVAVWAVAAGPLLAIYLYPAGQQVARTFRLPPRKARRVAASRAAVLNTAVAALLAVLFLLEGSQFVRPSALATQEQENYPIAAVTYLAQHRLPSRALVSYNWAGYFLWRVAPRYQDFIDPRADTVFTGRDLQEYLALYGAGSGWRRILDRRRVDTVLVEQTAPLAGALGRLHGWHRVYSDRQAVIYVRASR